MQMLTPSGARPYSYTKAPAGADASSIPREAFLSPLAVIDVAS